MSAPPWAEHDRQSPTANVASPRRQGGPGDFARPAAGGIANRQAGDQGDRQPPTASRRSGWGDRQRHAGVGDRQELERQPAELARQDDWADADDDADDTARADIVLRDRGEVAVHEALDNLRFANLKYGTPREILADARTVQSNFSQFPFIRAMGIAFYYWVTAGVMWLLFPVIWLYVLRFHRAVISWPSTALILHFVNDRVADGLVPDGLDVWTWSPVTWAWGAGAAFAFLVTTVVVMVRARW